jgi:hypothetical protein
MLQLYREILPIDGILLRVEFGSITEVLPRIIRDSRNLSLPQAVPASTCSAIGSLSMRSDTGRTSPAHPGVRSKPISRLKVAALILVVPRPRLRPIVCF